MKLILGGYLETALVHYVDEVVHPDRNRTTHPYYVCLNRYVPRAFFERAATFVALADEVIVPSIDWGQGPGVDTPISEMSLGLVVNGSENHGGREWDEDAVAFSNIILDNRVLTIESWVHASRFDTSRLTPPDQANLEGRRDELRRVVAHHYICRLLLQVRASTEAGAFLVLSEPDLALLGEIVDFVLRTRMPTPFPLPEMAGRVLDSENFAAGILNFTPRDAIALVAVKQSPLVRRYAAKVTRYLRDTSSIDAQRELLRAMKRAQDQVVSGRKVEKIFEVMSWVAKPIHYFPVIGTILTVAEDTKDIVAKWAEKEVEEKEWYLLSAKMNDIAINDYLARQDNLIQ